MPVARRLALALALWLGARSALAQEPPPPAGEVLVTLDFQDADITEVISTIAKATGKNFLYDDRVRGRVTVISPEPVTADEAYRVFESILAVKGFTTVPSPGGILKILPLRDAKENPIETVPGNRVAEDRDTFITRLMPLRYVKADAISDTIKPLVSKDATVIPYGPTNTLIITDSASNIRRLTNIIDQIDVSTYQETIKLVPIQFADANQLVQQLQQIFGDETGGGAPGQPGIRRARAVQQPQPGVPGVPGSDAGAAATSNAPRFIADERTNAIVVIATKNVLREVERIITLLDYKRKGSGRIHVYRLRNADADEIAQTLSSLASGSPGAAGAGGGLGSRTGTTRTSLTGLGSSTNPAGSALGGLGGLGGGGVGGAAASAVAELGDGVRVTADAPTNSLIIQASAEAYATLSEVIEALDTRRPQVMVEALIMEVNATPNSDLGAAWITTMATKDGSTVGIGSGNLADANSIGAVTGLATGSTSAVGFVTAFLGRTVSIPDPNNPGQFIQVPWIRALIAASETDQNTNIISAPTILTADKKEAEIVVGQNIPVPTSRLQAAGTTTDPNNPFQTSQNISRQDVGVTLRVTPQISEGDTVRLNVFQEISEVVPATTGDTSLGPTTTNRKVENTVYVRDGEAVMIGGILSDVQHENESKVPWLGDIPILGWAFKGTHDDARKINLLIVLTPRIVRDPEDLQRLTVENRERFKSASSPAIDLSDEEKEDRRKALEAGIPLPIDPNPVRRELDRHDQKYPVESLPGLRQEAIEREKARETEIEALKKKEASVSYLVQVAHYATAEEAVAMLQKLIKEGYDGTVLSQSEQGTTTHWVQLGPYTNEAKAQSVARDLNASYGVQSLVVVEP